PLTIFVYKLYCWCGWTRLYHTLGLGSSVCTLLYYCQSDKTGLKPTSLISIVISVLATQSDWSGLFTVVETDRIRIRPLPGAAERE
ncbi:MAG: hypothetical protein KME05_23960, partial [Gloeocapsa sp. UFS-A4-WI-NPMV-4B04]|nr:hypothetical protein [Gloeocapsa sp. UFS-A4-WI-NPMV-4B04]